MGTLYVLLEDSPTLANAGIVRDDPRSLVSRCFAYAAISMAPPPKNGCKKRYQFHLQYPWEQSVNGYVARVRCLAREVIYPPARVGIAAWLRTDRRAFHFDDRPARSA